MRLRTGLRVLWRGPDEVQVGTDPRWAIRIQGLEPAEVDLLTSLDDGSTDRALVTRARAAGIPPARVEELVALLVHAQLTTPDGAARPAARPLAASAAPDVATWSRLLADGSGAALVDGRSARVVGLLGLGRLGLSTAVTLAAAGTGTLLLEDDGDVAAGDLGVGGYTARDVGSPRRMAAARILRDVAPDVRTTARPGVPPDVMVLVEHGAADAVRSRALMSAGVVHLSVVVREADVLVGPLVRPGSSPCLRCLDLSRTDQDERWPAVAAQLASSSRTRGAAEESVLAAIGGALAAGQVLAELDGTGPRTVGAALEIALPAAVPEVRTWSVHPSCGCTDLPAALASA
ncbi:ThiF family adenylyltransferase [Cellulomonas fimi]|uniref:Thiamine biosynthesis protein ThiF n=1 Tax=Cellulomonas fimi TaxID=1708 RepID=A0A7Y0QGF1_CELFI|nr:ThiF family adenylyltransferase [Cellulomonas fimi]NMR19023.1 thiamine biosynthesis protein ThiF [Cellulomonas fimi]